MMSEVAGAILIAMILFLIKCMIMIFKKKLFLSTSSCFQNQLSEFPSVVQHLEPMAKVKGKRIENGVYLGPIGSLRQIFMEKEDTGLHIRVYPHKDWTFESFGDQSWQKR